MGSGIIGYHLIAPQSTWLDATYMTVITLATVGYGEVIDLSHSPIGRIFTMVLILFGMGNILFVASTFTEFITDGELQKMMRRRKMQKMIDRINDHVILCGSGMISRKIIDELSQTNTPFVLITQDDQELSRLIAQYPHLLYILGDASHDQILIDAGIKTAKGLMTALTDDRDNLFIIITAKRLNESVRIVSSANNPENIEKYNSVGVHSIISPNQIGGLRMASEMIRPSVVTFLDIMMRGTSGHTRFSEVVVQQGSALDGKTIQDMRIRDKTGLVVISIKHAHEESFVYNPEPQTMFQAGTAIIVIGSVDQVALLTQLAQA
jgi:voltage-gated potassium channel